MHENIKNHLNDMNQSGKMTLPIKCVNVWTGQTHEINMQQN